jgi:hypothetical protein
MQGKDLIDAQPYLKAMKDFISSAININKIRI